MALLSKELLMPDNNPEIVDAMLDAIGGYDVPALAALIAPNGCIVVPEHPVYVGPAGAAELVKDLARSFSDWKPTPIRTVCEGDFAAVEWTSTIIDFGGSESRIDGCAMLELENGKIARARFFFRPEDRNQ